MLLELFLLFFCPCRRRFFEEARGERNVYFLERLCRNANFWKFRDQKTAEFSKLLVG